MTPLFTIGTATALPGQVTRGLLQVGQSPGHKAVYVPLILATGHRPGPVVLLSGTIHGDEIAGIETIRRFIDHLDPAALRGTLLAIPVMNPTGYAHAQRNVFEDDTDLNRAFPGKREGTLAEQIAWHLFEQVLRRVDYGIDIHDAGKHNMLLPHSRIHTDDADHTNSATRDLGLAFGTEIIMERAGNSGMMAIEAQRLLNLPILTVELGGSQRIDERIEALGVRGIHNLLSYLGVLDRERVLPESQLLLRERNGIPAPHAGVLRLQHPIGSPIAQGTVLAEIHDPLTARTEQILAPSSGILFSRKMTARVEEGESVGSLIAFQRHVGDGVTPVDGELIDNHGHDARLVTCGVMADARALLAPDRRDRMAAE